MSVDLLAISVGNTRVHLGVFVEGSLEQSWAFSVTDNAELNRALREAAARLAEFDDAAVYLASVNPIAADRAAQAAVKLTGLPVQHIGDDVAVPIGIQLDPESIVGVDRLLNAAAAYDRLQQACVVVDVGTAVTVDFIDGAGTFQGGAILPGAQLMLRAMHEYTEQLPDVTLARPDEAIGHNTAQAMLDGVFHGIRGAVRELVEKYAETYGAYPNIVATGGDADLLFSDYELIESVVPELTLMGLAVTARHEIHGEPAP